MTKNARYILEIINHSTEHLTAEQIYLRLREKNAKAVLATVYNNLSSLLITFTRETSIADNSIFAGIRSTPSL